MNNKAENHSKNKKTAALKGSGVEIKKKIPYINLVYASLAIDILLIIFLFLFQSNIPPEVPLFYGYPDGENQLAQKTSLMLPPLISIATVIPNSFIAYLAKDNYVKKTLVISGFVITLLFAFTTFKIVFLVGSF